MTDKSRETTVDFFDQVRQSAVIGDSAIRPMNRSAADAVAGATFILVCNQYAGGGSGGGGDTGGM